MFESENWKYGSFLVISSFYPLEYVIPGFWPHLFFGKIKFLILLRISCMWWYVFFLLISISSLFLSFVNLTIMHLYMETSEFHLFEVHGISCIFRLMLFINFSNFSAIILPHFLFISSLTNTLHKSLYMMVSHSCLRFN